MALPSWGAGIVDIGQSSGRQSIGTNGTDSPKLDLTTIESDYNPSRVSRRKTLKDFLIVVISYRGIVC